MAIVGDSEKRMSLARALGLIAALAPAGTLGVLLLGRVHDQGGTLAIGRTLAWFIFLPLPIFAAGAFPLRRGLLVRRLPMHVAVCVTYFLLKGVFDAVAYKSILAQVTYDVSFAGAIERMVFTPPLPANLLFYMGLLGVIYAVRFSRKYRDRELYALRLDAELARARLESLQMQLQPHFLFNTLNAISTLIHKDAAAADRMVVRLSDLLRCSLDRSGATEVSLRDEIDFLRRYLGIETVRFCDRLTVEYDVAPDALEARIPNMVLQPLVENAVRHGVAKTSRPVRIRIAARREDGQLQIVIEDNGPGFPKSGATDGGIGLTNTQKRFGHLYGNEHRFELAESPGGGASVRITIPFREAAGPSEPKRGDDIP